MLLASLVDLESSFEIVDWFISLGYRDIIQFYNSLEISECFELFRDLLEKKG